MIKQNSDTNTEEKLININSIKLTGILTSVVLTHL